MPKHPLVSIIIPTFNRAHLIGETLDSVLAQTYHNWECIVVDDGSTDGTDILLTDYMAKDSRFQYHHRPDTYLPGGNGARNYGFKLSTGKYIQWLDSDDLISENKFELQVAKLNDNPNSVSSCMWGRFSEDYKSKNLKYNEPYYFSYTNASRLFEDFGKNGGYFPCHAYLVDRDVLSKSGLWMETLQVNQDGEFFCRVLIASRKILFISETSVYYRFGKENNVSYLTREKTHDRIKSWKLIGDHIYKAYGKRDPNYIKTSKYIIYNQIKNNYPYLRFKYPIYFWKQIIGEFVCVKYLIKLLRTKS